MKKKLYFFVVIICGLLVIWEIYIFFKFKELTRSRVCNIYPALDSGSFFWNRCGCNGALEKAEYGMADPIRIEEFCLGKIERRYVIFDTNWISILEKMGGIKEIKGKKEALKLCDEVHKTGTELYGSSEDMEKLYTQCVRSAEENF